MELFSKSQKEWLIIISDYIEDVMRDLPFRSIINEEGVMRYLPFRSIINEEGVMRYLPFRSIINDNIAWVNIVVVAIIDSPCCIISSVSSKPGNNEYIIHIHE